MRTSFEKTHAVFSFVCKQPRGHLNRQLSRSPTEPVGPGATMQHEAARIPSVFLLCEGRRAPTPADGDAPQNFAETLPTEMSVRIFGELDAESLCSAAGTCKLWHRIIEQSDQLWRRQCLLVRAFCQREVDSDRRNGLSWKVTLVRNYTRCRVKTDWLRGRYSQVNSADELIGRTMTPLDVETWGDILQAELDR